MVPPVGPIAKAIYLCDDVLANPMRGKIHLLGVFNAIRPPAGTAFPYRQGQLCVVIQLVDAFGEVPISIEIIDAQTEGVVYVSPSQQLRFPSRHTTITACFRVRQCWFATPGVYLVEVSCKGTVLDDRSFHLLAPEDTET
jgi:hypothetical protein